MDLSNIPIRNPQDILSLPGYRERVDPEREPLNRLLKHYYINPQMQCSLCGTWHNDGYVVLLENGGVTNIRHDCGEKFGEKFAIEERAYREKILRPEMIRKLGLGKARVEQSRLAIERLVNRVHTLLRRRRGLREQFPVLSEALWRRANQGRPELVEDVERSEQEIEDSLAINPNQKREALRYRQVPRGRIAGLSFLIADANGVVFDELQRRSEEFRSLEGLHAMAIDKLLEWERWLNNLDARLKEAERIATDGEAFFTDGNLQLLALIAQNPKEKRGITRIKPVDLEQVPRSASEIIVAGQARPLSRRERRRREFGNWRLKHNTD